MKYDIEQRARRWEGRHHDWRWYPVKNPVGRWWTLTQATIEAAKLNHQIITEAAGKAGSVRMCRLARQ